MALIRGYGLLPAKALADGWAPSHHIFLDPDPAPSACLILYSTVPGGFRFRSLVACSRVISPPVFLHPACKLHNSVVLGDAFTR